MAHDRLRGRLLLDDIETGLEIYFTFSDLARLQRELKAENIGYVIARVETADFVALDAAIKIGVKRGEKPSGIQLDALTSKPMAEIKDLLLDGLMLSMHGKLYAEYMDEVMLRAAEIEAQRGGQKGPPLESLETGSTNTDEPLSGQEFSPINSGD